MALPLWNKTDILNILVGHASTAAVMCTDVESRQRAVAVLSVLVAVAQSFGITVEEFQRALDKRINDFFYQLLSLFPLDASPRS